MLQAAASGRVASGREVTAERQGQRPEDPAAVLDDEPLWEDGGDGKGPGLLGKKSDTGLVCVPVCACACPHVCV